MGATKKEYFDYNEALIRENIVKYMAKKGIKQTDLAYNLFNAEPIQISNRLKGKCKLTAGEYMAICDYLDVPYCKFMTRERGCNNAE